MINRNLLTAHKKQIRKLSIVPGEIQACFAPVGAEGIWEP